MIGAQWASCFKRSGIATKISAEFIPRVVSAGFASSTFGKMETLHSKGETQVEEILSYEGETVKAAVVSSFGFYSTKLVSISSVFPYYLKDMYNDRSYN